MTGVSQRAARAFVICRHFMCRQAFAALSNGPTARESSENERKRMFVLSRTPFEIRRQISLTNNEMQVEL